ncbi:MAG: hypothetical protein ACFFKA_18585, partial [Candidatus Thorarchaeota archaeon]
EVFKKDKTGLLTTLDLAEKLKQHKVSSINKTTYRMAKERILLETQIFREKAKVFMLNEEFFPSDNNCGVKDEIINKMILIFSEVGITDSSVYLGDNDFNDEESEFLNERMNEIFGDA